MDEEIRGLLEEELITGIQELANLETGSKERSTAIEDLTKLYRLKIEEDKTVLEFNDKCIEKQNDNFNKNEQLKEQIRDRYFRIGLEAAGIILPLTFYAIWMKRGFKFEETGTYTSTTFRGLFNRFKPTAK